MNPPELFLDKDLMLQLEQMSLTAKSRIRGTMQGQRRSKQLGTSLDFADYRLYSPGDDFRQLDWNAYGRTGKPFIKLFMDEQELQVNLMIDASKSMEFGANEKGSQGSKFHYARQLAACIGYVALAGYDRVSASLFSTTIYQKLPLLRGKGSASRLFQFLAAAASQEQGDILNAFVQPSAIPRQRGITWVFSDFLYESGVEEALTYLRAAGQDVVVVHVLSPLEVNPQLSGDLRLVDSERGEGKEVAMSAKVLKAYQDELHSFTRSLQKFCYEKDISYVFTSTDTSLADTVFRLFRSNGVVG